MNTATSSPVTDAAIALLRTSGRPIGDGEAPAGAGPNAPKSFYPYAIVHSGTVQLDGSLVEPKEDAVQRIHVISVGRDRKGCEWMRDTARALLLDRTAWSIDGYAVVWTDLTAAPDITREDVPPPSLWTAVDLIDVKVTPVSGS